VQPVEVLHPSVVQAIPSSQLGGGPPTQVPALQTSPVVHEFPSLQAVVLFAYWQPSTASQESSVQALPSLQSEAFGLWTQESVVSLQESLVQATPSLQLGGVPAWQAVSMQRSDPLQNCPSSHCPSSVHVGAGGT
jgi:hypothetical protein